MTNDHLNLEHSQFESGLAELVDKLIEQMQAGEKVQLENVERKHPQFQKALRAIWPSLQLMNELNEDTQQDLGSNINAPVLQANRIGDFQLIEEIGRGGMGVVYSAEQISMGRTVALKVLPFAGIANATALKRFKNEVRAAATLNHPNIVSVFQIGEERGVHYFAMQLIRGRSLDQILKNMGALKEDKSLELNGSSIVQLADRFPDNQDTLSCRKDSTLVHSKSSEAGTKSSRAYFEHVAGIGVQAAQALDHAHQRGVVHRDVKPANLMIEPDGKLFVTDFGLAQIIESDTGMTMTGDLVGTLRYMSPEQALAKRVVIDHRTDIYSLGASLYEMLTFHPVISGSDRQEILRKIAFNDPIAPRSIDKSIPLELETVVLKALAKDPVNRYETAAEFAEDLQRFINREPVVAVRPSLASKAALWVQRHSAFSSGVLSTLAMTTLLLFGLTAFLIAERRDKNLAILDAQQEKQHADENFDVALQGLKDFLLQFANFDLAGIPGAEARRQVVLQNAAEHFNQLVEANPDEEELQKQYAQVLLDLADASLKDAPQLAKQCFQKYFELNQQFLKTCKDEEKANYRSAMILASLGQGKSLSDRPQAANHFYDTALKNARQLNSESAKLAESKSESVPSTELLLAQVLSEYAQFLNRLGQYDAAIKMLTEASKLNQKRRNFYLAEMAQVYCDQGKPEIALQQLDIALRKGGGQLLENRETQRDALLMKARILAELDRLKESHLALVDALINHRRSVRNYPTRQRADVEIQILSKLASLELRLEKAKVEFNYPGKPYRRLERALSLHRTYYVSLLDQNQHKIRVDLERDFTRALEQHGYPNWAKFHKQIADRKQDQLEKVKTVKGYSFPIQSGTKSKFAGVALDSTNHLYVAGNIAIGSDLDPGPNYRRWTQQRSASGLLAKYSPEGALIWSCQFPGAPADLCLDSSKNVYLSGLLDTRQEDRVTFGDLELNSPGEGPHAYLSKVDVRGVVQWVRWLPHYNADLEFQDVELATVGERGIVIKGRFRKSWIDPKDDSIQLKKRNPSQKKTQAYIIRINQDGQTLWARSIDAESSKIGGIDTDVLGNTYIVGRVSQLRGASFGINEESQPFEVSLQEDWNANRAHGFIAKIDPQGKTQWVRLIGSRRLGGIKDLAIDSKRRIYVSMNVLAPGDLDIQQQFDDERDQVDFIPHGDFYDANLSCWDEGGKLQWSRALTSDGFTEATSLAPRLEGGVMVFGRATSFENYFGESKFFCYPVSRGSFVSKVSPTGNFEDASFFCSDNQPSRSYPIAIATNSKGYAAMVGRFSGGFRPPTGEIFYKYYGGESTDAFVTILEPVNHSSQ